jgi:hypothetical protein
MERKEMMKKLLGGLLIGGLVLGGGGLALAGSNDASTSGQSSSTAPIHGTRMPGIGKMNLEINQSILDSLVSAETLSQAQADTILAQAKQQETDRQAQMATMKSMTKAERETYCQANKPKKVDLLAQLVTDGTITPAQVDAIQTATQAKMQEQRQTGLDNALSGLEGKAVITSDQATAIKDQLTKLETTRQAQMQASQDMTKAERQAQMENMKSMTAAQRQAYMQANKPELANPFAELVTAGTLTPAQADQVSQALHFIQGGQGMHRGSGKGEGGMRGPGPQAATSN